MDTPGIGVSGISIDGDQIAGQFFIPHAKSLLRRLAERVRAGGIQTASDHVRLSDSAYCYGIVSIGIQRAVIVCDGPAEEPVIAASRGLIAQVPDFVSGASVNGRIQEFSPGPTGATQLPELISFWPTPASAVLHGLNQSVQPSQRLAVKPYAPFSDQLGPPSGYNGQPWSQLVKCKPTLYSGLMRGVVQLLLGFGRQLGKSIYDRTPPKLGTARQRRQNQRAPTQYQSQVKRDGLQIRYDWRWHRTHGIGVGADGKLWLVEIGNTRGVIAMPLPMNDLSLLPAFREKLVRMGDTAGVTAIDSFGGFPTGEAFPAGNLDAWVRAGRVVRMISVEDMQPFYSLSPFSSALGWAFNERGDEARNIGYEQFGNIKRAAHFGVSLSIGPYVSVASASNAATLRRRIEDKSSEENYAANLFKIDRLAEEDISEILSNADPYSALDAAIAAPPATANAHLWLASRGFLHKEGRTAQYELKYPWPELGYLVSMDLQPQGGSRGYPRCDTDVHVFFVGNELKTVRFFNDTRTAPSVAVTDDTDGCEFVGTFVREERQGVALVPAMVYSSDFDDRRELVGYRSIRTTKSRSLGNSDVSVVDTPIYPPHAVLARRKRFLRSVTIESWSGESIGSAMVVPFHDRCAYYYARISSSESHVRTVSHGYTYLSDPWTCGTWRNFPGYTGDFAGDINNGYWVRLDEHPSGCGPVTARTVRAPGATYSGGGCSDFADGGPWCFTCDNADAMVYSIPEPPTPPGSAQFDPPTAVRTTFLVNASGLTPIQIEQRTFTGSFTGAAYPWFTMSPDPDTNDTQYAVVTHNALGDGSVMSYSRAPNDVVDVIGQPQPPGLRESSATFIGVVP